MTDTMIFAVGWSIGMIGGLSIGYAVAAFWLRPFARKVEEDADRIEGEVAEIRSNIRSGARRSEHRFRL